MASVRAIGGAVNGITDVSALFTGSVFGVGYDHAETSGWRESFLRLAGAYIEHVTDCNRRGVVCGRGLAESDGDGTAARECGAGAPVFDGCGRGAEGTTASGRSGSGVSFIDARGCEITIGGGVGVQDCHFTPEVSGGAREGRSGGGDCGSGCAVDAAFGLDGGVVDGGTTRGKHYARNRARKEKAKRAKAEAQKSEKMRGPWRGYCETVASEKPSSVPSSCPGLSSATTSQSLIDAEAAARESLAKRRVVENELAMAKAKAQIASYADVEKSKAIAELKIARIAQWNNEARMKSQKSWADYKRSLESSPVPSFKASDLPSAASAGEYWWKQQCLKSKEMEEQIKHLEALLKASMPYVTPEGLEKMREVPDPEPVIDPEFEALKRAHRELAVAEGLDGYDSGDDIGYDLFMPPRNL